MQIGAFATTLKRVVLGAAITTSLFAGGIAGTSAHAAAHVPPHNSGDAMASPWLCATLQNWLDHHSALTRSKWRGPTHGIWHGRSAARLGTTPQNRRVRALGCGGSFGLIGRARLT